MNGMEVYSIGGIEGTAFIIIYAFKIIPFDVIECECPNVV